MGQQDKVERRGRGEQRGRTEVSRPAQLNSSPKSMDGQLKQAYHERKIKRHFPTATKVG